MATLAPVLSLPGPAPRPVGDGVDAFVVTVPLANSPHVCGDWSDVVELPCGGLGVIIGDAAGWGTRADPFRQLLQPAARRSAMRMDGPAEAIADLRAQVAPYRDMFATMVYAALGPLPGTVVVASAGHPPPLIVGPGGSVCFLEGGLGPALGVPWSEAQPVVATELPPGSTLVLYTDGLVDSARRQLDEGLERLASVAGAAAGAPLSELCRRLVGLGVEDGEPTDDLTVIALRTGTGVRCGPTALGSWVSTTWSLPRALRHAREEW